MANNWVGSPEHKSLFCRFLVASHQAYRPAELPWPDLDEPALARLRALSFWGEAVRMESETALAVQVMARIEKDPELKEAIGVQGVEEGRHAELLQLLARRYGMEVGRPQPEEPREPQWQFMRIGYAECFDSFFAFGLFAIARDSGFFPPPLVEMFEPIVQEEARHILFHTNWVAYLQARLSFSRRPGFVFRRALSAWHSAARRVQMALKAGKEQGSGQRYFTLKAHRGLSDLTPGAFLRVCLSENERRLSNYDARLLRPTLVPKLARAAVRALA